MRTRRGPSSPRRSASGRSGGRTIPRAHGRLWVSGRARPPRASVAPGSASGVGRHRAGFARSILGPSPCGVRWDPPCGLRRPPGASSSGRSLRGERDHTEVRRTEPRVDAEPGPATARVPSRSPLAPSEAASDTSGMSRGKMTLDRGFGPRAPVPAPPPTTGHGPSRRLRALVGEMPELGELTPRPAGSEARGSRRFREARGPHAEGGPWEDGLSHGPRAPSWGPRSRDAVRPGPQLRSLTSSPSCGQRGLRSLSFVLQGLFLACFRP